MDYRKIYCDLIQTRKNRQSIESEYYESHHIIPKCLGGTDERDNIVKLTAREHYLAHWLLYKIHKTSQLVHAWHAMSRIGDGQEHRRVNSHLFEYCKKVRAAMLSKEFSGEKNNFFGRTYTIESRKKMSVANMGKVYKSPAQIQEWVEVVAKMPKSPEHRAKIGRKGFRMLQHTETLETIRVHSSDPRTNDPKWVNPRKITPEAKRKCRYCDMITTPSMLSRWHDEKCKHKEIYEDQVD